MINTMCGQNLEKGSVEKGGPLLENKHFGVPYLEKKVLQALY